MATDGDKRRLHLVISLRDLDKDTEELIFVADEKFEFSLSFNRDENRRVLSSHISVEAEAKWNECAVCGRNLPYCPHGPAAGKRSTETLADIEELTRIAKAATRLANGCRTRRVHERWPARR